MSFHVGQKVVCVNGNYICAGWRRVPHKPVLNGIYTIRAVFIENWGDGDTAPAVHLDEIINPADDWTIGPSPREIGFAVTRFRPVIERKTDISIFTEMLTPKTKQLEDVRT